MTHKQTEDEAKRAFSHGSSGSTADMAVEGTCKPEDRHIDTPHSRQAEPLADEHIDAILLGWGFIGDLTADQQSHGTPGQRRFALGLGFNSGEDAPEADAEAEPEAPAEEPVEA